MVDRVDSVTDASPLAQAHPTMQDPLEHGFAQDPPRIGNQWRSDLYMQSILERLVPDKRCVLEVLVIGFVASVCVASVE